MTGIIVIPSRYASSRFPGKPLCQVAGRSLIERVWRIASAVPSIDRVLVATDDRRIAKHVAEFGGECVMTPETCVNGTERVAAALNTLQLSCSFAINLQGDNPLLPPWVIEEVAQVMLAQAEISFATPAVALDAEQIAAARQKRRSGSSSGTFVTFDRNQRALYFSRAIIPDARRDLNIALPPVYRHIGLYAYRPEVLQKFVSLPMTPLEETEGLEQLRALENGISIRIVPVDYRGRTPCSIDHPEDVQDAEAIIAREGELLPA